MGKNSLLVQSDGRVLVTGIITRTNECSICLWRTHELLLRRDIWRVWRISQISLPKTSMCSQHGLKPSLLFILWLWVKHFIFAAMAVATDARRLINAYYYIHYHTIHLILIWSNFCIILWTILYKKVVPAMWSPFWDHIAGDHIKISHSM